MSTGSWGQSNTSGEQLKKDLQDALDSFLHGTATIRPPIPFQPRIQTPSDDLVIRSKISRVKVDFCGGVRIPG